ncbi:DUF3592 domain-containing protein [uncultured Victivallis sp.]|uniref:DUF3592 domain-containing protein n=1 Tax=uncultured Victivallis sp. TaxID=354118 RepID=UPI0025F360B5|nr:DUF3592 domain-containing protein [uncultured Victivallis sp.]
MCWCRELVIVLSLGFVFLTAGMVALWYLTLSPVLFHFSSGRWVETPATVISCELASRRDSGRAASTFRIAISYEYLYDGRAYVGDRYDAFQSRLFSNIDVDGMQEIVRRHPVGSRIICRVNPDEPSQALVDRSLPGTYYLFAWFPLAVIAGGVLVVMIGFREFSA